MISAKTRALGGHETHAGNYFELVKLRVEDSSQLNGWLTKTTNFMAPESQNEVIKMYSHTVLIKLTQDIKHFSAIFNRSRRNPRLYMKRTRISMCPVRQR